MEKPLSSFQDDISYQVDLVTSDIAGFCHDYPLRRHKNEDRANDGSIQCRTDWVKYIGPIERWGSCNPYEGHFGSLVLPICKLERLNVASHVFECMSTANDDGPC